MASPETPATWLAISEKASDQLTRASSFSVRVLAPEPLVPAALGARRAIGWAVRSGLLSASNPKRPLSQSQPQLTGSLSTPRKRTISSELDWAAVRQPTAHKVQVVSTCSRSQGRALKRYGLANSAPTGQICTTLPLKLDTKGSPGKIATSVVSLRDAKSMPASPATSSAKRVQRAHWMQRSRSISTSGERGVGLSQCRFSSMKRVSPGP